MSFKCGDCGLPQKPGIYPVKRVVKRRIVNNKFQTVKELDLCPRCKHRDQGLVTVDRNDNLITTNAKTAEDLAAHFRSK